MPGILEIQALEFHGHCAIAGVLWLTMIDGRAHAILAHSEADGALHVPARPYTRNEGLPSCAARALCDWTAGAINIGPRSLHDAPILCVGDRVYFIVWGPAHVFEMARQAMRRNTSRDTLRGTRPATLPIDLVPKLVASNAATSRDPHPPGGVFPGAEVDRPTAGAVAAGPQPGSGTAGVGVGDDALQVLARYVESVGQGP
jgi:hypothetical protein